jgi:Flp pilus assembly protein TadG
MSRCKQSSRVGGSERMSGLGHGAFRHRAMALLQRFRSDQRGNVVLTAGILLPVVVGAVGAAVTYSSGNATRNSMQVSLDSAVLAGAIMMDSNPSDAIDAAQKAFQSNVNNFAKTTASNIAASFKIDGAVISGQASGIASNPFGGLIGGKTYSVNATAAATKQTIPVCVLGLNGLDNGSFDVNGKPDVNIGCAVQANSSSRSGMTQEGKAEVKAKKFGVTGGHKTNNYSPPPSDGSPKVDDPYALLPFPYTDDCNGKGKKGDNIKDSTTLSPGTYCGGIHVYGDGTKVTLEPGIYVMKDGPFWIDGNATITGDRVMIAFTGKGSTLQIWGDSVVNLTSPVSGLYTNMQFFQDRNDDSTRGLWASVGGSSGANQGSAKLQFDGVAYFPTENFWVFGNSVMNANSPSMAIVADKIWVQGSATFTVTNNNPRNLPVTVPQTTYGARLLN